MQSLIIRVQREKQHKVTAAHLPFTEELHPSQRTIVLTPQLQAAGAGMLTLQLVHNWSQSNHSN